MKGAVAGLAIGAAIKGIMTVMSNEGAGADLGTAAKSTEPSDSLGAPSSLEGVPAQEAADKVLSVLQEEYPGQYDGKYKIVLSDLGKYKAAGVTWWDRFTGQIQVNKDLFSTVTADNFDDFAWAIAHEVKHHHQTPLQFLRDSNFFSSNNQYHEQLNTNSLNDTLGVRGKLREPFGWSN